MPRMTINEQPIDVQSGATILQAVRQAGVELSTLCYWEGLPPYGACRLCLVEMSAPRQEVIASCAYPVEEGMIIDTRGERRRGAADDAGISARPLSKLGSDQGNGA